MQSQSLIEKSAKVLDEVRFLASWFDNPLRTGAVSPSGPRLARAMASFIDPSGTGPVIELGPGTGSVTKAIVDRGIAPERLVLIEFHDKFCELLRKRFPGALVLGGDAYAVRSLLSCKLSEPAVAAVSGLPLLTKPPLTRTQLLEDCFSLMQPGAPFIQFTYALQPPIPPKYAAGSEISGSCRIWNNLPPARVWAYRQPGEEQ